MVPKSWHLQVSNAETAAKKSAQITHLILAKTDSPRDRLFLTLSPMVAVVLRVSSRFVVEQLGSSMSS
jgi:hypothetical protein